MKKSLLVVMVTALAFVGTSFAATFNLPANDSSKVWTTPKLTGTNYMQALNSRALTGVPADATSAVLTTTLDKKGTTKLNYNNNTYTITVGYTSCKVADRVSRTELPKTITVDLTNVKCINKKNPVNFLPEIKAGKRINVFFAKINGITKNTVIAID